MGRQTNFFMVGDDESDFIDFILNQGDSIINRFGNIMTKQDVITEKFGQVYIVLPQSVIKMKSYGLIDDFASNVIEYDRSLIKEKRIEAGRIYIELIGFDEQGNKYRKEEWIEEKFNTYKKWIVKHCMIDKDKRWYIGKSTYLLYKNQGYKMVDSLGSLKSKPGIEFE
jgi:hypothetical protein